jgi:hypothetical protein
VLSSEGKRAFLFSIDDPNKKNSTDLEEGGYRSYPDFRRKQSEIANDPSLSPEEKKRLMAEDRRKQEEMEKRLRSRK